MLSRSERQEKYGQRSIALWFTGLSGSGKSTIAIALEKKLFDIGYSVQLLDGDNIRSGINSNLGFSEEDRIENIRRISEVSRLFIQAGLISINCFISPSIAMRDMAKSIIGEDDFKEVYINTPLEVCEARDVKGLYAKARKGEIKDFTGIDAPYEEPVDPDFEIRTENKTVEECVVVLMDGIIPLIDNRPIL